MSTFAFASFSLIVALAVTVHAFVLWLGALPGVLFGFLFTVLIGLCFLILDGELQ